MHRIAVHAIAATTALLAGTQPSPAVTISGNYYEDQKDVECTNLNNYCKIVFPLPSASAGNLLNIHYVACNGYAPSPLTQAYIYIADSPTGTNARRRQSLGLSGRHVDNEFSWRDAIEMKVTGGPPRVIIIDIISKVRGDFLVSCSLTGELETP